MIYIAPAIYRSLNVRTAASLQAAIAIISKYEQVTWMPLWGDAAVTRARSLLATKFLKEYPAADILVMFDDDIVFHPEDLVKIIEGARETKGIYGGAYMTHSNIPNLTCNLLPNQPDPDFRRTMERRPLEIEYVAAGFTAIHRDVLEAVAVGEYRDADGFHKLHLTTRGSPEGHFIPFFDTMTIEESPGVFHWLSEDWAFCERARQLGFKCFIDQSIILGHITEMAIMTDCLMGPSSGIEKVEIENHE